jgi:flagellin-like protein
MTTKIYLKKAKAISPIIATIILIVITVVAGGFIYAYVSGMLHSGATSQQASIQSYSLIPSSTGATLTVTVQNSGTVAIKNVTVSFSNASITAPSFAINAIEPGSTASTSTSITGIFLAGDTYTATFVVTYANGATQDITEGLVANTY